METEAKIKVQSHDSVRQKLQAAGATAHGRHLEINTFFDTEDRSLMASDKGLRIRVSHDLESDASSTTLTYKGPRQPGNFKAREEFETTLGAGETLETVFDALGYLPILTFEKRRESWTLGNCKVELDELPYLGLFVEVEGPDDSSITKIANQLGLSAVADVKTSYAGMLATYCAENGISEQTLRFGEPAAA